jgi:hypothetical protein
MIKAMGMNYRFSGVILFALVLLFGFQKVNAQKTVVKGVVTDAHTQETLPFVNVVFKNSLIGTITDSLGYFMLETNGKYNTVEFSSIGYSSLMKIINVGVENVVNVKLTSDVIALGEVKVRPNDEPVRALLRKLVENKPRNNPEKHNRFTYEKYTKWEYHINNVGEKLRNSRTFKDNQSFFKQNEDSTFYLPVYFSEQLVFNQFQREPLRQKSTILADKTAGLGFLQDFEVSGYTSGLDIEVNFYDNFINLFTQNFVSPTSDNGWFYYKYYLEDSTMVDGTKHYRVMFTPRRVGDKVFRGHMVIEDRFYSLVEIDATLSSKTNLNFVKALKLKSNYQVVNDTVPFYKRNQIDAVVDYIPINVADTAKKRIELYFTQMSSITKVDVNPPDEVVLSAKGISYESKKDKNYDARDTLYWNIVRHEPLSTSDRMLYATIDSINQLKMIRLIDNTAQMYMTGYFDVGKFELGPWMNFVNYNKVENLHLFFGGRTSSEISKQFMLWGGAGYGTRNKAFYGSLGAGYKFPVLNRRVLKLSYSDNVVRMGENEKILYLYENSLTTSESNLMSVIFSRDEFDELFRQKNINFSYEHEFRTGFSGKFNAAWVKQYSPEFYPFDFYGIPLESVSAFDASLDFRFSWKEKLIDDEFLRFYVSTDYPIVHFTIGGGRADFFDQQSYYYRFHSTVKQNVYVGQTLFEYALEGGMIFGQLPYTMLEIPRGNETFGYYTYDFNLLNYMEFVNDRYLNLYTEYHLNGFFFNRLPLLKRLGLREVLSAKGMLGSLSDKQFNAVTLPTTVSAMNAPYLEVGAGIENVFRFFRFDGIWRISPQSKLGAPRFGVRAYFEVRF